ncbi:MAG: 3-hydroxyacyl-CoA dehydrogenase NAD-binding domain-containing protein, partial [Gemmatimonadota bacterium]|nr:3-hydroxyacyl-CoA dehydrogenase NAD-binding domain-containing protein [Gemmatimonadota bacterium]
MTKTESVLTLKDCGEGILAIVFDRPDSRVNLVDERWLIDMTAALDEAEAAAPKGLLLLSAKPGNFIAGADISLIASLEDPARAEEAARTGQALLDRLEDLPFPTVAAIGGSCLGGGFETAMACTWRVAADGDSVILGLPEVRLGILPGFGGTWRLPRLTGVTAALPLILTGGNLRPKQALARGVVDRLAAPELLEEVAAQVARTGVRRKKRPAMSRLTDSALGGNPIGRAVLRSATRRGVLKKTGGHYPAAPEIIDRVIGGLGLKRKKAMAREAEAFGRLAVTPESKSLLFLFQGSEALARHPWTGAESPVDRTSAKAGVIGAGTMGGGIAGALATRGLAVRLKDTAVEPLRVGLAGAAAPLNRRTRRRALHPRDRDAILARISPTTGDTGMADAAFVIEAVPEVLDLKIAVFRALEDMLPPTAYLATNTSSIPISRIAAGLSDPTRLVGIHFFNPVDRMPLVEIIPGEETAPEVLERAVGLVRRLKKTPLVVADRPGFLVNRLLLPYLNEAAIAVAEGVGVDRI